VYSTCLHLTVGNSGAEKSDTRRAVPVPKGCGMLLKFSNGSFAIVFLMLACVDLANPRAHAASCTTQSQMTQAQRDSVSTIARNVLTQVQSGNVPALQQLTLPSVAANFNGLMNTVQHLQPLVRSASITIENLYLLDATDSTPGATQTDFFCGSPVVVFNIPNLPQGMYAIAILHATGVRQPEQVSLILAKTPNGPWALAGLFDKPMMAADHDGLWYWQFARKYAQQKWGWNAWFYYRTAAALLAPLDFLSSPNLDKLHHEADAIRPADLPGTSPITISAQGAIFKLTTIDTSTALGGLDLDVRYTPESTQAAQLHDPVSARRQVTSVMSQLLRLHPELRSAFHGIWVHADQGTSSLFALELPMDQIVTEASPTPVSSPVAR
jgi:hypothetical protein